MSAMFAFAAGEVTMRSGYFAVVIGKLRKRSADPVDLDVCADAEALNCLWVDQIPAARKCAVLRNLDDVLGECLSSNDFADNETARLEFERVRQEIANRFPDCLLTAADPG